MDLFQLTPHACWTFIPDKKHLVAFRQTVGEPHRRRQARWLLRQLLTYIVSVEMTHLSQARRTQQPDPGAVASKALMRAAARLGVSNKTLAAVIGLSEASVSRMRAGTYHLAPGDKAFELALLFIRLFRSLDAIVDGDEAVASAWLRAENRALGQAPLALIQSVAGLTHVLGYLDARRSLA